MKNIVKRIIGDEKGAALLLTLILLLVGGLIAASLLSYMGSGILVGRVYDTRTAELYAADAGVEDAVWRIQTSSLNFGTDGWSEPWHITANHRNVTVKVYREDLDPTTCGEELVHRILATAMTEDGGVASIPSSTTVEVYLTATYMDFSGLLDYAIVSQNEINIQPNNYVDGDVWLPDADDLEGEEYIGPDHTVYDSTSVNVTWPGAEDLSAYYWRNVEDLQDEAYYAGYVINIPAGTSEGDPYVLGPLLADGDLTIQGTGWIRLDGTIYVKGDLTLKATPELNLSLDGQTIFAEGGIYIPPGVTLSGSGCIIAIGDITFQPNMASAEDDFVLVLSIGVGSKVILQPNGNFTGCIAANDVVTLRPGDPNDEFTLAWISPEGQDLNFPMGVGGDPDQLPPVTGVSIDSWEISQQ